MFCRGRPGASARLGVLTFIATFSLASETLASDFEVSRAPGLAYLLDTRERDSSSPLYQITGWDVGFLIFEPSSPQSPLEDLARREFEKAFSFDRGEWTVHKFAHAYRTLREDGPAIQQFTMGGNHYGGGRLAFYFDLAATQVNEEKPNSSGIGFIPCRARSARLTCVPGRLRRMCSERRATASMG